MTTATKQPVMPTLFELQKIRTSLDRFILLRTEAVGWREHKKLEAVARELGEVMRMIAIGEAMQ